ncbi:MAG TPA: hypothetical protein VGO78_17965 [Acidimicrobiales bacterium]|nr:hypothetical protein [Acidimicrobiales bacterium]
MLGTSDVHRLRDLDRRQRIFAAAFAVGLALAPLLALVHYAPHWFPAGDPALMALRSLDVGTSRTPLIGQPSLSFVYIPDQVVNHLGAVHFYMMAPFVHLLGVRLGMLVVSVLITGPCLLLAAWVAYRQLGRMGGACTAVVLGAVSFTTGAASLVNPVSSNIAGYPFLLSAFLMWALVCGDLRLLPLAVGVVSFTALQHLSVLPALAVMVAIGGALMLWLVVVPGFRSAPREERRRLWLWGGGAALVAFVLWLPVLVQNLVGTAPNLEALVRFSASSKRPKLGYSTALKHVAHVLGLPPVLGRTELQGSWLFTGVAPGTWLSAAAVLGLVGFAVWRWRTTHPAWARLGMMTLALVVAGVVGSATVPEGQEQARLVFYHWIFPLVAFVVLVVGLLVWDLVEGPVGGLVGRWSWARPLGFAAALVVVVVPALVNPQLTRWSSSTYAAYDPFPKEVLDGLADQVMAQTKDLEGPTVLMAREPAFDAGLDPALALALQQDGLDLRYPRYQGRFVDDEWLVTRSEVEQGLVLQLDSPVYGMDPVTPPPGGELIAEQKVPDGYSYFAHWDHDLSKPEAARICVYLLDRADLLAYATSHELAD